MPYSTNPERVIELLPYMPHILDRRDCQWDLTGRKTPAQTFAYRLREALYISKLYPDRFTGVANIADDVVIEVEGSIVYARFGKILNVPLATEIATAGVGTELHHAPPDLVADTPIRYSLYTIRMLWDKRQGDSIQLPMYVPTDTELIALYEWAQEQSPQVMLMPSDNLLNLVVASPELDGMQWTPAEIGDQSAP